MADLSFGVSGPTMDFTVTMKIADQDAPRILNYLASTDYGKVTETVTDADGNETQETRDATTEETARAFAAGILRGLLDQTVRFERNEAAKAAAEQVSDIQPVAETPVVAEEPVAEEPVVSEEPVVDPVTEEPVANTV